MPKKYRLSRAEFSQMRGFKRLHGRFFSLSYGRIAGRTLPGAACVVSKKAAASAVVRNRIKRRCRSLFPGVLKGVRGGTVFVYVAKKGAGDAAFTDVKADIEDLTGRTLALLETRHDPRNVSRRATGTLK